MSVPHEKVKGKQCCIERVLDRFERDPRRFQVSKSRWQVLLDKHGLNFVEKCGGDSLM